MVPLADFLKNNKKTVSTYFRSCIYVQESNDGNNFEAIRLQSFGKELAQIGIQIEEITLFCLFAKFKFAEEIESIDVNLLREELENYGIIEVSNDIEKEKKKEDLFYKLGNYLKQQNLKLTTFLEGKISNIEINYKKEEVVKNTDIIKLMNEKGLSVNEQSAKLVLDAYCKPEYKGYVFFGRFKSALEFYFKKVKKVKERPGENHEKDRHSNVKQSKKELEDNLNTNDIPNADSKVFNESLDGDNDIDDEKQQIIDFERQMANIEEKSHEDTSRSIFKLV
jgi:hypothetical protein